MLLIPRHKKRGKATRSAPERLDSLEVSRDYKGIRRSLDPNIAALGDSCRSAWLRHALDPQKKTGEVTRLKPSCGFGVPIRKDSLLLVHGTRMAVD